MAGCPVTSPGGAPECGGPPARGAMSVSVISPDPALADGLDTALFVLGQERALEFVKKHPGLEVIIVNSEGKISTSREAADGQKVE